MCDYRELREGVEVEGAGLLLDLGEVGEGVELCREVGEGAGQLPRLLLLLLLLVESSTVRE